MCDGDWQLPAGLPAALVSKFYEYRRSLEAYCELVELAVSYGNDRSFDYLEDGDDVRKVEAWLKQVYINPEENYDQVAEEFLEEVFEARTAGNAGDFCPQICDGRPIYADIKFPSAYAFVSLLSHHISQMIYPCRRDFPEIPLDRSSLPDDSEPPLTYSSALLELVYLVGQLSALPLIFDEDDVGGELVRETIAVAKRRAQGSSWVGIGDNVAYISSVGISLSERWGNLSGYRRAVLTALFKIGAINESTSCSARDIAARLNNSESDPRLRENLSYLRDSGFVGGKKGQRGYWLSEDAALFLESIQSSV